MIAHVRSQHSSITWDDPNVAGPRVFGAVVLAELMGDFKRDGFYVSRLQNMAEDWGEAAELCFAFEDIGAIVKGW